MENPKVSVVIPVFNREKTIKNCLESLRLQSFESFEVIVVDDGSSDGTSEICKYYQSLDSRFTYFYQANSGVSVARNRGISLAKGEWITFIDSDDVVSSIHLSAVNQLKAATGSLIMVSIGKGKICDGQFCSVEKCDEDVVKCIDGNKEVIDYLFGDYNPYINSIYFCTDKFFHLQTLRDYDIRFREDMSLGEDQVFLLYYLKYTNSFAFIDQKSYLRLSYTGLTRLGSKLRLPVEFWYNQRLNFEAFKDLYSTTNSKFLYAYACNYIIDRPITRILFRYTQLNTVSKVRKRDLMRFMKDEVVVYVSSENVDVQFVKNSRVKTVAKLLLSGHSTMAYWASVFYNLVKSFISLLKPE